MTLTLTERFWAKVDIQPDGCWEWTGYRDRDGYGLLTVRPRGTLRAHRLGWELAHGEPPPKGVPLDHLCRNRGCVRPSHLEIVTPQVNAARSLKATATECVNGHAFDDANTYRKPNGTRACKRCRRDRMRKRRAANAAASRRYRERKRAREHLDGRHHP